VSSDDEGSWSRDVNGEWPVEAHYVPVLPNARNLSIREQPPPMRRMIRAAVTRVTGDCLFDSAYPVAAKVEFETFYRNIFISCAKHLKYSAIVKRLQRDDELVKLFTRVVSVDFLLSFFHSVITSLDQCSHFQSANTVQESY
jgi:hypothetical protein